MAPSLLDVFRALSSFDPPKGSLVSTSWTEWLEWSIAQGLAPLWAYNLEYRLGGAGAPEWAREQLLSVYQGSVNDNVMKLLQFKRTVDALQGRKVLVLGAACFADALYPHVAFRPVPDIELLVSPSDVEGFAGFVTTKGFRLLEPPRGSSRRTLTDDRTELLVYAGLLGPKRAAEEEGIFARALPYRAMGESCHRPDLEDALLLHCLSLAREGFWVPTVSFVDLRELFTGASSVSGPYSRPLDVQALLARARAFGAERALYVASSCVARLFPQASQLALSARPSLRASTQKLLDRMVVANVLELGKTRQLRAADRLARYLMS